MDLLSSHCPSTSSVGTTSDLVTLLLQTLISSYCSISLTDNLPEDFGYNALKNGLQSYDFVIVGGGSAGSVVANRLSENPNWNILLLEAGGDPPIEAEIPLVFTDLQGTDYDWKYYAEYNGKSCLGLKNKACFWPRGKMLGGTGSMNAMIYVRGTRKDFDTWKSYGNPSWGYDDVLDYFKKSENIETTSPLNLSEHGTGGPLSIDHFQTSEETEKTSNMLIKAANELGYKYVNDFTESSGFIGFSRNLATIHKGRRCSAARAFLVPTKSRKNLHVIKYAHVKKLNFNQEKKLTNIEFVYKNSHHLNVNVRKEAILSAGSIGTPQILMLSGIGPADHLKENKIPIIEDLNVGKNLQDHIVVHLFFSLRKSNPKEVTKKELIENVFKYLMNETSLLSSTSSVVGFVNTKDSLCQDPDIEYQYLMLFKNSKDFIEKYLEGMGHRSETIDTIVKANSKAETLMAWIILLNPESKGEILLNSSKYEDHPKVHANYLDKDNDVETLLRGLKLKLKFLQTEDFKKNEVELMELNIKDCDKIKYKSDDYWRCYIRYMTGTVYHPVGTSKMGPKTDEDAVVDSELRVHNMKNLRVADASIMPKLLSANTNAATIMIGEKVSDFIKKDWSPKSKDEL